MHHLANGALIACASGEQACARTSLPVQTPTDQDEIELECKFDECNSSNNAAIIRQAIQDNCGEVLNTNSASIHLFSLSHIFNKTLYLKR
ncbi:hypothetical protein I4U23_016897 [Adineta vaga]|nr:hypothetical protein I4U23_016897 [Adineta vaga]